MVLVIESGVCQSKWTSCPLRTYPSHAKRGSDKAALIGKDLPITVGIIIEKDYIKNLRVLTYRENRGGEVATASFTDQFSHAAIEEQNRLDVKIDGISGATLSVQALTRLATMALFLNTQSSCNNDT